MASPIARAVQIARQNPALTVAVGGVGLAAAVSAWRRPSTPPEPTDAVAGGGASPIAGYGPGLTASPGGTLPGDPFAGERAQAVATITNAIAAQTNAIAGALASQQRGSVQPLPATPTPKTPTPVPSPSPAVPRPTSPPQPAAARYDAARGAWTILDWNRITPEQLADIAFAHAAGRGPRTAAERDPIVARIRAGITGGSGTRAYGQSALAAYNAAAADVARLRGT